MEALRLCGDVGQHRIALFRCQLVAPVLEESGVAEDRGHRRPQLVRDEPQELVLDQFDSSSSAGFDVEGWCWLVRLDVLVVIACPAKPLPGDL